MEEAKLRKKDKKSDEDEDNDDDLFERKDKKK